MIKIKEEEIIEKIRKMLFQTMEANECGLSNNDFKEDIQALSGMLGIYENQKEKLKLKENKNIPENMKGVINDNLHIDVSNFILSVQYNIINIQIKLYELEKEIKELKK